MLSYKYLLQNINMKTLCDHQQVEYGKCISRTIEFTAYFKILLQKMARRINKKPQRFG
jgi:hypothetical protein